MPRKHTKLQIIWIHFYICFCSFQMPRKPVCTRVTLLLILLILLSYVTSSPIKRLGQKGAVSCKKCTVQGTRVSSGIQYVCDSCGAMYGKDMEFCCLCNHFVYSLCEDAVLFKRRWSSVSIGQRHISTSLPVSKSRDLYAHVQLIHFWMVDDFHGHFSWLDQLRVPFEHENNTSEQQPRYVISTELQTFGLKTVEWEYNPSGLIGWTFPSGLSLV